MSPYSKPETGLGKADSSDFGPLMRRRADAIAAATTSDTFDEYVNLSPDEICKMLHELRVHQIELGMQNEELRRSQVQLDDQRALYFDLYDLAPVGYCTLSNLGLLLKANLTAGALLGLSRSQLIGKPISRFILKADQDVYYLHRKMLVEQGDPQSCELQMVRADGVAFWANLVSSEVEDADGDVVHRIVLSDISDRKRMEQSLQVQNAALEEAKKVADKANRAKSEFLSSMSHELRTPLNAILGFAQLLECGVPAPTPGQKSRVDQILKAGWYLLDLVNEILDLAVIEAGSVSLALEPLLVSEVLDDCQAMIEPLVQTNGITVTFCPLDAPLWVWADRLHFKQVLVNLISNAIKYNRPGGTVAVACSIGALGRLRTSVRDTGHGLSVEKLDHLFQPFNRLGQESGSVKGTGIGLVVSKRLVELMGGEIGVHSTVGEGSVFWVELDLADAPAQAAGDVAGSVAGVAHGPSEPALLQADARQHSVLYVEDNPENLQLVEEIFARRPELQLLTARDAPSGIALARSQQPSIILMDIHLPGMSGLKALKVLREDPATQHIPVVALSANAMATEIESGLEAGFFRYVTKPIKVDAFMAVLDAALEFSDSTWPPL
jgi:PAS domain S-box-containing protein